MASINAADRHKLDDLGGIAPGKLADILVIKDLKDFECSWAIVDGEIVAQEGNLLKRTEAIPHPPEFCESIRIRSPVVEDFRVSAHGSKVKVRVIRAINETITDGGIEELSVVGGNVVSDPDRDILKMTVIDKSSQDLEKSLGFVQGIGLKRGALATTLAWDTYNILALGVYDRDIALAVERLREIQGGFVVMDGGRVLAELALPIGGVISDLPMDVLAGRIEDVGRACKRLGSPLARPYLVIQTLPFTGLPFLRLTDKGLLDLRKRRIVDVIVS